MQATQAPTVATQAPALATKAPSVATNAPALAHIDYILHLADNALVHGQRIAEWCSHGPVLEEDIAMANIGLDHIGQARMLYQHAAKLIGGNCTEDKLAYFRHPEQFLNYTLLELPHRTAFAPSVQTEMDYAVTIARNFLYASLMILVWEKLQNSQDAQLAAIAGKSVKEVRYHLRHSTDWMLRLGDGTPESHTRMQAALDYVMPFTQEWWAQAAMEKVAFDADFGVDVAALRSSWQSSTSAVMVQATLKIPSDQGYLTHGKQGQHSEHLSYLLAEMQSLARAHPEATW
jgi:ring-1,2-phenylacetyl-CoA epoxidase subunit PaaC